MGVTFVGVRFRDGLLCVLVAFLAGLVSGCGGTVEDTAAAPSATSEESDTDGSADDSPSPDADALPEGWERHEFGVVSVAIPDGWGYVTQTDGKLDVNDVDLGGEQLDDMRSAFDDGAVVLLVDADTVSGGLLSREDAMTSIDVYTGDSRDEWTQDDLVAFLEDGLADTEFEIDAFRHPAAPAAVATYTVVQDDIDYFCRDYAVGTAIPVAAYFGTDPHKHEDRVDESDAIVRSIRVE
jgi:hypothetical protein